MRVGAEHEALCKESKTGCARGATEGSNARRQECNLGVARCQRAVRAARCQRAVSGSRERQDREGAAMEESALILPPCRRRSASIQSYPRAARPLENLAEVVRSSLKQDT